MKKMITVVFIVVSMLAFSVNFDDLKAQFTEANSERSVDKMEVIIDLTEDNTTDANIMALNAEAMTEIANWGYSDDEIREELYEKAVEKGKAAVEIDSNSYTNFVTGAAIGRLAQYKGIVSSLFMLGDFDDYISKSIELNPDNFNALVAMGMRYRDTPWPTSSKKKSEQYLKQAIEAEPEYINAYLELGILYKDWGREEEAIEMFKEVLERPVHPDYVVQGREAKIDAEKFLEELQ
jgi:tetratricopeptide (TPR) repeat protein